MSTTDICGHLFGDEYEDSFFVISKDGLQVYTNSAGFKSFSKVCTLIQNLNMYTITKTDEADPEKQEVVKVARFYEMIHDKKKIAMPCRKLDPASDFVTSESQMVEKWPIIQAYGLDMVGNGFFTMKHQLKCIRDPLDAIYQDYDSFSKFIMLNEEIERLNVHYFDNFFSFNKDTLQKRQQRTEHELIEAFWFRYKFSLLQKKKTDIENYDDGLPLSRALVGQNTNKPFDQLSETETRLYKFNHEHENNVPQHFTIEYVEKNTNLRFCRTYFLTNLSQNYMRNIWFSEEEEFRTANPQGKINELNAKTLFQVYRGLIQTYDECSDGYLKGKITTDEIQAHAFQIFKKYTQAQVTDFDKLLKDGKDSIVVHVQHANSYGLTKETHKKCASNRMIMIRIQIKDVLSQVNPNTNLGSLVYANSFIMVDD